MSKPAGSGKKLEKVSTNIQSSSSPAAFGPGQPSRTSIVVAALRAFGAREPDAGVRNPDWLAEQMLTSSELELITEHPIARALTLEYEKARQIREVAGMSNLMVVRTRYIDERLQRAIENEVTQIVILGAGFDTRAYRFAEQLKGKKVFELDYQSTQDLKKRRLKEVLGSLPAHVRFVEVDFKKDSLREVLSKAGYQSSEKAFFIWEGVSMYLSEGAVRETLRTISNHSVAGSSLVMDFAERASIQLLAKFPHLSQHKYTTHWGEPWIFGVPDMRERDFFRSCGLEPREILSFTSREAAKRYLTRADGSRLGRTFGGPPSKHAFSTTIRVLWTFLTHRSRWYALADLAVGQGE
jgi:methyltransferase (TIGR00027 family)